MACEESEAMVIALRNTFMPRLAERDASVFATMIRDLWPDTDVPMVFGGNNIVYMLLKVVHVQY